MTRVTWRYRGDPEQRSASLPYGEVAQAVNDLGHADATEIRVDPVPDVGNPTWGGELYVVASLHHEDPQRHGSIGAHLHQDYGAPCGEEFIVQVELTGNDRLSGHVPQHTHHLPRCDDPEGGLALVGRQDARVGVR